jgi:L-ascorbate metabolism protein UlaG (beta-lactamase superfamily)
MEYAGIEISWLGHDGFRLVHKGLTIYIDPFQIRGGPPANLLLITHEHFDHLSPSDIRKVARPDTEGVAPEIAAEGVRQAGVRSVRVVRPGDVIELKGVKIEAHPAYNVNKFRSPGRPFHPREENRVGYVLELAGTRIYHAGDTDFIPEMQRIRADVALLPVSGVYVMTAEEAASAVRAIRPRAAIPMHWGAIVGSEADARRFEALAKGEAQVFVLPKQD